MSAPQVLQIPVRARLTDSSATRRLFWRQLIAKWSMPIGTFLTETPVTRLPRRRA